MAQCAGLLAFVEVKARPSLAEAAHALGPRQRARLVAAAECWIAENPGHGAAGMRFDVNHHSLGSTSEVGPVVALKTAGS